MATTFPGSYQVRRKSRATWVAQNYILLDGEIGLETDFGGFKFGNGVTGWNGRPYASGGSTTTVISSTAQSVPYSSTIPLDTAGAGKIMPETTLAASTVFSVDAAPVADGTCQVVLVGDGSHSPDLTAFTNGNAYAYSSALNARNWYTFSFVFGSPVFVGILLPGVDAGVPTLVSATVDDADATKIQLVWSEAMDPAAISAAAAFTVSSGHPLTAHTRTDSTHTFLTTSTPFIETESAKTLAYAIPGSLAMKDLAGNQLLAIAAKAITINVTNPQISAAVVANSTPTKIDLTWTDTILSTSIPAASSFAVSAGHALLSHVYIDSTHTQLTTSSAFVGGEAARTLSYTPGTNPIKDLQVVSNLGLGLGIAGEAITNNVVAGTGPGFALIDFESGYSFPASVNGINGWTVQSGAMKTDSTFVTSDHGIIANSAPPGGSGLHIVTRTGKSDLFTLAASVAFNGTNDALVIRYVDDNNFTVVYVSAANQVTFIERIAGAYGPPQNFACTWPASASTAHAFSLAVSGQSVGITVDAVLAGTATGTRATTSQLVGYGNGDTSSGGALLSIACT